MNIEQPFKKTKARVTAIVSSVVAAALALVGFSGARNLIKNHVNSSGTTSSISDESDPDISNVDEQNLYLSENFDITNANEVKKRAQAIYDISEKKVSVDDIVNIIYLVNGKYENIKFKNNDDVEMYKYMQNMLKELAELLNDNIDDDVLALQLSLDGKEAKVENDKEIFAYMFIPSGEEKELAIKVANIINEQLENISKGDTKNYETTMNKYYKMYEEVKKVSNAGLKYLLQKDYKAHNPVFTLTNDKLNLIGENDISTNKALDDALVKALDLDTNKIMEYAEENGYGKEVPKNGKYYEKPADADSYAGGSSKEEIVDEGGASIGSNTVQTGGGVIGSDTDVETVNPGSQEGSNEEVVEQGGEVVGTEISSYVVDIDDNDDENDYGSNDDNDSNVEIVEEGGEVVEEYSTQIVVEEGGEIIDEYYVDEEYTEVTYSDSDDRLYDVKNALMAVGGMLGSVAAVTKVKTSVSESNRTRSGNSQSNSRRRRQ